MDAADVELRNTTYRLFVEYGRAPSAGEVASDAGMSEASVLRGWRSLHDAHALVLDAAGEIRMANPFAAQPTPCRVEAGGRPWFATCAWDAFGIGAALRVDSTIIAECADCHTTLQIDVRDGRPDDENVLFHVLVPAASWWNDIGYT